MRLWRPVFIIGTIIFILGIVFHLQGHSVVGPETSFMYANPDWISYGIQIAAAGIIISGTGVFINFLKRNNSKMEKK